MNIRTIVIVLVVLILIPIILEQVETPISDFFKNPKKAFPTFINNVWSFYKDLLGNGFNQLGKWFTSYIGNIIDEKIGGKKIEIQLK